MRRLSDFTLDPSSPSDEKRHYSREPKHLPFQNPVNWHDEGKPKKIWVWCRDTPVLQSLYTVPTGLSFLHVGRYTSKANNKGWARRRRGRTQLQRITSHTRWHDDLQDKSAGSLTTDVFILYLTFASKQLLGHDARTGSFRYEHTQKVKV